MKKKTKKTRRETLKKQLTIVPIANFIEMSKHRSSHKSRQSFELTK